MQNFLKVSCVLLLLLLNSCDKCEDIACSTGPPNFTVELVDAVTGENLFTNGKYMPGNIKVTDELGQKVYSSFFAEYGRNSLLISVNSTEGDQKITLAVGDDLSIPIKVKVYKGTANCCTNYFVEDVAVQGYATDVVKENGIIKIKI